MRKQLGAKFCVDEQVKTGIKNSQIRFAQKRGPAHAPSIQHVLHLEFIACCVVPEGPSPFIRLVAAAYLAAIWVSLRIFDLQRMTIKKWNTFWIECVLSTGKGQLQKGGPSKPQDVWIALNGVMCSEWWRPLELIKKSWAFFVPEFQGPPSSNNVIMLDQKCERLQSLLDIVFQLRSPRNIDLQLRITLHSARHFLSTVADVTDIGEERSRLLGRWKRSKARDPTLPKAHSGSRIHTAIQTILVLIRVVIYVVEKHPTGGDWIHLDPHKIIFLSVWELAQKTSLVKSGKSASSIEPAPTPSVDPVVVSSPSSSSGSNDKESSGAPSLAPCSPLVSEHDDIMSPFYTDDDRIVPGTPVQSSDPFSGIGINDLSTIRVRRRTLDRDRQDSSSEDSECSYESADGDSEFSDMDTSSDYSPSEKLSDNDDQ